MGELWGGFHSFVYEWYRAEERARRKTLIESGRLRNGAGPRRRLTKLIDDWMGLKSQKSISWSQPSVCPRGGRVFKQLTRSSNATAVAVAAQGRPLPLTGGEVSRLPLTRSKHLHFYCHETTWPEGGRLFLEAPGCLRESHKREAAVKRCINTWHRSAQLARKHSVLQKTTPQKSSLYVKGGSLLNP